MFLKRLTMFSSFKTSVIVYGFLNYIRILLLAVSILAVSGCSRNNNKQKEKELSTAVDKKLIQISFSEIIKKSQDIPLSFIGKEVQYIPLETSPKSLISFILNARITKDYIFLHHRGSPLLVQYDLKGKFIRNIGKIGKGPGEYNALRYFSLDEKREMIYIQENWRKEILIFSFKGEYQGSFRYKDDYSLVSFGAQSVFICFKEPLKGDEKDVFSVLDTLGVTYPLINNHCFGNSTAPFDYTRFYTGRNSFYHYNNQLNLKGWYNDTVYTYKNKQGTPHIFIDLQEHKLPDNLRLERVGARILPSRYYWTSVSESSRFIFVNYSSYDPPEGQKELVQGAIYYDKETAQGYSHLINSNYAGFVNDFDDGPFFRPEFVNDSVAYSFIQASDFVEQMSSRAIPTKSGNLPVVGENDNPVLMIVKLRGSRK